MTKYGDSDNWELQKLITKRGVIRYRIMNLNNVINKHQRQVNSHTPLLAKAEEEYAQLRKEIEDMKRRIKNDE